MKAAAFMGAGWLFLAAAGHVPFGWTHTLTDTCSWRPRPVLALLGRGPMDNAAAAAEWRCWAGRGARDPDALPTIHVLLRRFPSTAELVAMEGGAR